MIDLAETEYLIPVRKTPFPINPIYQQRKQKAISYLCGLVGINRQRYYRSFWLTYQKRSKADQVIALVNNLRIMMPRLGTRKIYHMLKSSLHALHVGRDKLFSILKANNMLIKPKRNYRITTDSHHRFRKHKNLIENMALEQPEQVWVSDITYIGGRGIIAIWL